MNKLCFNILFHIAEKNWKVAVQSLKGYLETLSKNFQSRSSRRKAFLLSLTQMQNRNLKILSEVGTSRYIDSFPEIFPEHGNRKVSFMAAIFQVTPGPPAGKNLEQSIIHGKKCNSGSARKEIC